MKLGILFLTLFAAGSVQAAPTSGGKLGVGLASGQSSFLFPSSRKSCALGKDPASINAPNDIMAKYFELDNVGFAWTSTTSNLHIIMIKVQSTDARISLSNPVLTMNEIENLYGKLNGWNGVVPKAVDTTHPTVVTTDCPLIFGGVSISNANDVDFTASAELLIQGIAYDVDAQGNEMGAGTPVTTLVPFKIMNVGNTNPPVQ